MAVSEDTAAEDLRRRRRPTGESPPLPPDVRWRGVRWGLVSAAAALTTTVLLAYRQDGTALGLDVAVSHGAVALRNDATIAVARILDGLSGDVVLAALRWLTLAVLIAVRRLRHLAVALTALFVVTWSVTAMNFAIARPRPMVVILGDWSGFSHPSRPIAALAVTLLVGVRVLVPHGPWRRGLTWTTAVTVALVGLGRMILGVDHLTDVVVAAALGIGIPLMLFRLLAPTARYPITYRHGETAHVDLEGERRKAITHALRDQMAWEVLDISLHGAEGSAGSTPMRIRIRDDDGEREVFAKLYTRQHVRSDRLYKLVRSVRYGRLEDEQPFNSVRRLVQYEDHMSRLIHEAGVDTPRPLGIVEITPDREYLLAFEFVPGEDIDQVEVDADLIDDGLETVARLWDAGLAHRDLKPANVMVAEGRIRLVDTAFAEVRPTPWRQAVDLGAMMLVLALQSDPETVYERASQRFSEDELSEAFAATRGLAIPGQLQRSLEADDRDVLERLRELAPSHDPIRIQRWGLDRTARAAGLIVGLGATVYVGFVALDSVGML